MQPDLWLSVHAGVSTCSTLRRVEPHATGGGYLLDSALLDLQYPQTGRTSCNFQTNTCDWYHSGLQYPLTGRTSGNGTLKLVVVTLSASCSTLRRVEPHATASPSK